jgi:EF-P beta-lysylation protein EpmB
MSESSIEGQILTTEGTFVPPHCAVEPAVGIGCQNESAADDTQRPPVSDGRWQEFMKSAFRDRQSLLEYVGLEADVGPEAEEGFPIFVTRPYADRIRRADPADPLLRQVLPTLEEDAAVKGFVADPVGDLDAAADGGLLHKYAGRALLITTGACAIHCRYCFRREFPYSDQSSRDQDFQPAIEYVRRHSEIHEVLLSGGDPWTLTDGALDRLMTRIESVDHVRRLRIHTRMPIVIPARVNGSLLNRIRSSRLVTWVVVHCNHAREIDSQVADALARLVDAGIPVLNQSVLLRGINDNVETLVELYEKLIDLRVMPYYLHQLDRARGTAHFEVPVKRGQEIIAELQRRLPGYAVPRHVVEQAGCESKTTLA